ncbi:MAG TPA: CaiB/BaiF CoA-transferase family protein, partial [Sphingomonadaceae bacterium]|nr:CaiB/BaiF CoA-transferase family protein [Sphingomonadaceae bacterium]
ADIRVVEMGTYITGPAAGMHLADLGADVIKVERPGDGDPFRAFKGGLYSPHYQTYNRNKKSIELNTKQAQDLAAFDELVKGADVFIQNFRPGVAERLGVDAQRLQAINPRLVYALITGFGSDGPHRDRPAFDTVAQASSGFLRLLVNPEHPRVVGPALADALTGFYAAHGVVAALYEREKTGKGRLVETSMFEAMCHFNLDDFTHLLSVNEVMGPYSRPHVSQSYVFECADGGWLALHMSSPPKFWENLAEAAGQPDMLQRPEFVDRNARIANYDKVIAFLAPIFKQQPRSFWADRLAELEVPHSPVFTSQEVVDGELAKHHEIVLETEGPHGTFRTIRSPLRFDGEKQETVVAPPVLGQHNAEILGRKPG